MKLVLNIMGISSTKMKNVRIILHVYFYCWFSCFRVKIAGNQADDRYVNIVALRLWRNCVSFATSLKGFVTSSIFWQYLGCSTIRPNTFRPKTFHPMSFCPKTICPTIFSPHDFCRYTFWSCMIYVQKYFIHNVLGHKIFSPKTFCLNTFSPCPLLFTRF